VGFKPSAFAAAVGRIDDLKIVASQQLSHCVEIGCRVYNKGLRTGIEGSVLIFVERKDRILKRPYRFMALPRGIFVANNQINGTINHSLCILPASTSTPRPRNPAFDVTMVHSGAITINIRTVQLSVISSSA
jgi:hypothetical protein